MEINDGLSAAVLEVLDKDNYMAWSVQVKTYLMAQDLWKVVEAANEPPKQEDDEDAFKAWRNKNSKALHVLKDSCGPNALSVIRRISSAKIAWNTLAVVLQVLKKDNYVDWSARVKTYLMAHDLWEIIEATTEPPKEEDNETAFMAWSKKNSTALHVIQISCGLDTFSEIIETSLAKIAWNTLAEKYNVPTSTDSSGNDENGNVDYVQYEALKKAVESGDWNATEDFLKRHPGAAGAKITYLGETALHVAVDAAKITYLGKTALHVAVDAGHEHIVEKLVGLMSEEDLAIPTNYGNTALAISLNAGNYRMAACMVRKNKNLLSIKDSNQNIPVIYALGNGDIKLARYLYSLTPPEDLTSLKDIDGATLCTQAIYNRSLDIASDLIRRCPRFVLALDKKNCSPFYALASMPNAFRSGDRLVFWKRWIYDYCIHIQPACATEEIRLNIQNVESNQVKIIGSVLAQLRQLISNVLKFLGIKDLYEMKLNHVQSHELLDRMCKEVSILNIVQEKELERRVDDAVLHSIKKGNFEFIFGIGRVEPHTIWTRCQDNMSIFAFAVQHRQAKIFSLIYGLVVKNTMTTWVDDKGNIILHMAGMSATPTQLNRIQGAALQMQRELQWFKEVESIVPPSFKEYLNDDDLTPRELFTNNHKDLMKEGEKWMKGTATSCTVVGALIVTIMFAAAFTVPGGNKQDTGFPIFVDEKLFMVFIISDVLSLFSSSTSVLMFLGILTSRYTEDDFLESLPRKMIIGLSTLFLSIAAMVMAFSAAVLIMLHGQSWIVIPVICLGSVPVTLFVLMQFPLLADMLILTYGPGIFDKKIERWV